MAATVPAWGTQRSSSGRSNRQVSKQRPRQRAVRPASGSRELPRSSQAAARERMQARALAAPSRQAPVGKYVAFTLLGALVAALVLLLPGLSAEASRGTSESHATSVVTVNPGDSLWTVAQRSMPDVDTRSAVIELRKANNLVGSELVAGQQLVIPSP